MRVGGAGCVGSACPSVCLPVCPCVSVCSVRVSVCLSGSGENTSRARGMGGFIRTGPSGHSYLPQPPSSRTDEETKTLAEWRTKWRCFRFLLSYPSIRAILPTLRPGELLRVLAVRSPRPGRRDARTAPTWRPPIGRRLPRLPWLRCRRRSSNWTAETAWRQGRGGARGEPMPRDPQMWT